MLYYVVRYSEPNDAEALTLRDSRGSPSITHSGGQGAPTFGQTNFLGDSTPRNSATRKRLSPPVCRGERTVFRTERGKTESHEFGNAAKTKVRDDPNHFGFGSLFLMRLFFILDFSAGDPALPRKYCCCSPWKRPPRLNPDPSSHPTLRRDAKTYLRKIWVHP